MQLYALCLDSIKFQVELSCRQTYVERDEVTTMHCYRANLQKQLKVKSKKLAVFTTAIDFRND